MSLLGTAACEVEADDDDADDFLDTSQPMAVVARQPVARQHPVMPSDAAANHNLHAAVKNGRTTGYPVLLSLYF